MRESLIIVPEMADKRIFGFAISGGQVEHAAGENAEIRRRGFLFRLRFGRVRQVLQSFLRSVDFPIRRFERRRLRHKRLRRGRVLLTQSPGPLLDRFADQLDFIRRAIRQNR